MSKKKKPYITDEEIRELFKVDISVEENIALKEAAKEMGISIEEAKKLEKRWGLSYMKPQKTPGDKNRGNSGDTIPDRQGVRRNQTDKRNL